MEAIDVKEFTFTLCKRQKCKFGLSPPLGISKVTIWTTISRHVYEVMTNLYLCILDFTCELTNCADMKGINNNVFNLIHQGLKVSDFNFNQKLETLRKEPLYPIFVTDFLFFFCFKQNCSFLSFLCFGAIMGIFIIMLNEY